ncbi:PREDICTED: uncharacterized protein LOC104767766 [Camelina sativa]|uniref:Uncharacterized protein LOC104767766 n=1 Tax=Camelina sativa TaxID=90675 RepID=A0ABM0XRV6_CAMSA|nr:PREDICTED: uncharacterized protein LOC104767766 [Camelina sativa]
MGIYDSSAPNMNTKESILVEPKPYRPQIPFPRRHEKKPLDEKKYDRYKEVMSEFIADIPFIEARSISLCLKRLPKLEDPGKFVVPCSILGVNFEDFLCDTGSNVNVMSKAIAERLGINDMKASKVSLKFANAVTTTPQGFINNLDVRVGSCLVATYFHVVEMSKGSEMPLILGRPFLGTVGAVVDLPNKKTTSLTLMIKSFTT